MRYSIVFALSGLAAAVPVVERATTANLTDAQILNYALTLEHLESTFYAQAVSKFTSADFEKLNLSSQFYTNLQEIASDEKTHVSFLTSALQAAGAPATAACTYNFGYTDAASFLATAALLEGVGVSAYLGAAQYIANKAYLTAAGSILTVEARHSAYLRLSQRPQSSSPFPSPFDIPLDLDEVYSLASLFITACPASNPPLPVKAFPAITVTSTGLIKPNQTITLKVAKPVTATSAFFITILGPVAAHITGNGTDYSVVVPANVQNGQEYLVLSTNATAPSDDNIVAGPAVVPIADNVQLKAAANSTSSGSGTPTSSVVPISTGTSSPARSSSTSAPRPTTSVAGTSTGPSNPGVTVIPSTGAASTNAVKFGALVVAAVFAVAAF